VSRSQEHPHSQLTHDTIYNPKVMQTPEMHRAATKSMALVEATSDYFEVLIGKSIQPGKELSKDMEALYRELVGTAPDPTNAEELLNDAYGPLVGEKASDSAIKLLFRQSSILLAYLAGSKRPDDAGVAWPLTLPK
jgi:hypothetical protein